VNPKLPEIQEKLVLALAEERIRLLELKKEVDTLKKSWESFQSNSSNLQIQFPNKIKLDIGGKCFTTTLNTLTIVGGSFFSGMFSGKFPVQVDSNGSYFVDRDPELFPYILNFLRGIVPDVKNITKRELIALKQEAIFFQIEELKNWIEELLAKSKNQFDKSRVPSTVTLSEDCKVATYNGGGSGWVNFDLTPTMTKDRRKIQFTFSAIGSGGVFIGVGADTQPGMNVGCGSKPSWGYMSTGSVYIVGESTRTITGYVAGDKVAVEMTDKEIIFYKNGTKMTSANLNTTVELWPQVTFYSVGDQCKIED